MVPSEDTVRAQLQSQDEEVRGISASSVGRIAKVHPDVRATCMAALARVSLNAEQAPSDVRGQAYASARYAAGMVTVREYGASPDTIEEMEVDWEWLRKMAEAL